MNTSLDTEYLATRLQWLAGHYAANARRDVQLGWPEAADKQEAAAENARRARNLMGIGV